MSEYSDDYAYDDFDDSHSEDEPGNLTDARIDELLEALGRSESPRDTAILGKLDVIEGEVSSMELTTEQVDKTSNKNLIQMMQRLNVLRSKIWEVALSEVTGGDGDNDPHQVCGAAGMDVGSVTMRLTPDILCVRIDKKEVLIGDVAVTRSVASTEREKEDKYRMLRNALQSANKEWSIVMLNFVLRDNMSNIATQLKYLQNNDVVLNGQVLIECRKLMVSIRRAHMSLSNGICGDGRLGSEHVDFAHYISWPLEDRERMEIEQPMPEMAAILSKVMDDMKRNDTFFSDTDSMDIDKIEERWEAELLSSTGTTDKVKSACMILFNPDEFEGGDTQEVSKRWRDDLVGDVTLGTHDVMRRGELADIIDGSDSIRVIGDMKKNSILKKKMEKSKKWVSSVDNKVTTLSKEAMRRGERIMESMIEQFSEHTDRMGEFEFDRTPEIASNGTELSETHPLEEGCKNQIRKYVEATWNTKGTLLLKALSDFYIRVASSKVRLTTDTVNYYSPGLSTVIIVLPDREPTNRKNATVPFFSIARERIGAFSVRNLGLIEETITTDNFHYHISKVQRYSMNKLESLRCSHYRVLGGNCELGYKIGSEAYTNKFHGLSVMLASDLHQRPSTYTDLLKYLCIMATSEFSAMDKLLLDKMNVPMKTDFDSYMARWVFNYVRRVQRAKRTISYPSVVKVGGRVTNQSYGLNFSIESAFHDGFLNLEQHINESAVLQILRPKGLYGDQELYQMPYNLCERDEKQAATEKKYPGWQSKGEGDLNEFPWGCTGAYCARLIRWATRVDQASKTQFAREIASRLSYSVLKAPLTDKTSLRGGLEALEEVSDGIQNSTAAEACFKFYEKWRVKYGDDAGTLIGATQISLKEGLGQVYTIAKKIQRGGFRPIATADTATKCSMGFVETVFEAVQMTDEGNVIKKFSNKPRTHKEMFERVLLAKNKQESETGSRQFILQVTEDKTKFSEEDAVGKFRPMLEEMVLVDERLTTMACQILDKVKGRRVRMLKIPECRHGRTCPNEECERRNFESRFADKMITDKIIRVDSGWMQGFLNHAGTYAQHLASIVIKYLWPILKDGLIQEGVLTDECTSKNFIEDIYHSDDSQSIASFHCLKEAQCYSQLRVRVCQMLSLHTNIKKSFIAVIGEVLSNYNANGSVHVPAMKALLSYTQIISGINPVIDTQSAISSIQTFARDGTSMGVLAVLRSVYKHSIDETYNLHRQNKSIYRRSWLPLDLPGGWPDCLTADLAMNGSKAHVGRLLKRYTVMSPEREYVLKMTALSMEAAELSQNRDEISLDNWGIVNTPLGNTTTSYLRMAIPRTQVVHRSIEYLREREYPRSLFNGLIKPITIQESFGDWLEGILSNSVKAAMMSAMSGRRNQSFLNYLASGKLIRNPTRVVSVDEDGRFREDMYMSLPDFETYIDNVTPSKSVTIEDWAKVVAVWSKYTRLVSGVVENCRYIGETKRGQPVLNRQPRELEDVTTVNSLNKVLAWIVDKDEFLKMHLRWDNYEEYETDVDRVLTAYKGWWESGIEKVKVALVIHRLATKQKSFAIWTTPQLRNKNIVEFTLDAIGVMYSGTTRAIFKTEQRDTTLDYHRQTVDKAMGVIKCLELGEDTSAFTDREITVDGKTLLKWVKSAAFSEAINSKGIKDIFRKGLAFLHHKVTGESTYPAKILEDKEITMSYELKQPKIGPNKYNTKKPMRVVLRRGGYAFRVFYDGLYVTMIEIDGVKSNKNDGPGLNENLYHCLRFFSERHLNVEPGRMFWLTAGDTFRPPTDWRYRVFIVDDGVGVEIKDLTVELLTKTPITNSIAIPIRYVSDIGVINESKIRDYRFESDRRAIKVKLANDRVEYIKIAKTHATESMAEIRLVKWRKEFNGTEWAEVPSDIIHEGVNLSEVFRSSYGLALCHRDMLTIPTEMRALFLTDDAVKTVCANFLHTMAYNLGYTSDVPEERTGDIIYVDRNIDDVLLDAGGADPWELFDEIADEINEAEVTDIFDESRVGVRDMVIGVGTHRGAFHKDLKYIVATLGRIGVIEEIMDEYHGNFYIAMQESDWAKKNIKSVLEIGYSQTLYERKGVNSVLTVHNKLVGDETEEDRRVRLRAAFEEARTVGLRGLGQNFRVSQYMIEHQMMLQSMAS